MGSSCVLSAETVQRVSLHFLGAMSFSNFAQVHETRPHGYLGIFCLGRQWSRSSEWVHKWQCVQSRMARHVSLNSLHHNSQTILKIFNLGARISQLSAQRKSDPAKRSQTKKQSHRKMRTRYSAPFLPEGGFVMYTRSPTIRRKL